MGLLYDSSFDCWMQCVSIIETQQEHVKIGTLKLANFSEFID